MIGKNRRGNKKDLKKKQCERAPPTIPHRFFKIFTKIAVVSFDKLFQNAHFNIVEFGRITDIPQNSPVEVRLVDGAAKRTFETPNVKVVVGIEKFPGRIGDGTRKIGEDTHNKPYKNGLDGKPKSRNGRRTEAVGKGESPEFGMKGKRDEAFSLRNDR
ncbi:MAG: hypothetical protein HYZ52_07355 [Candidatus Omnitrophica bacterium]|nr:hypothetical protein [Candidatus Omnitrophota bacterium]